VRGYISVTDQDWREFRVLRYNPIDVNFRCPVDKCCFDVTNASVLSIFKIHTSDNRIAGWDIPMARGQVQLSRAS
jgi:hypothetical protein